MGPQWIEVCTTPMWVWLRRYLSWAQLLVDTQVPGTSIIPKYSQGIVEVALEGFGADCAVDVWPPTIQWPGQIELGQVSICRPQVRDQCLSGIQVHQPLTVPYCHVIHHHWNSWVGQDQACKQDWQHEVDTLPI